MTIALLHPDLLGTYGDGGNAVVLRERARLRGIPADIVTVTGEVPATCDLYVLGGGEDAALLAAADRLRGARGLVRAACRGAPVLAVCAGMQILGESLAVPGGQPRDGLGLLNVRTAPGRSRAIGDVVAEPCGMMLREPLTGFENHLGRTELGPSAAPLARVRAGTGNSGNGDEGAVTGRVIGTYLHGPVLAHNPELADLLLGWAVGRTLDDLPLPAVARLRRERLARHPRSARALSTRAGAG